MKFKKKEPTIECKVESMTSHIILFNLISQLRHLRDITVSENCEIAVFGVRIDMAYTVLANLWILLHFVCYVYRKIQRYSKYILD